MIKYSPKGILKMAKIGKIRRCEDRMPSMIAKPKLLWSLERDLYDYCKN